MTQFGRPLMTPSEFDPARSGSGRSERRGPREDEPGGGPPEGVAPPPPAGPAQSGDAPLREALRPAGPPRFGLRVEHQPDSVVAHVDGELDILTVSKVAARINGVIRRSSGGLVLDLRGVEFMDSAGLQLLMNTRRRLLRRSRTLSVICQEGPVRRLIELMRLTGTLDVKDS